MADTPKKRQRLLMTFYITDMPGYALDIHLLYHINIHRQRYYHLVFDMYKYVEYEDCYIHKDYLRLKRMVITLVDVGKWQQPQEDRLAEHIIDCIRTGTDEGKEVTFYRNKLHKYISKKIPAQWMLNQYCFYQGINRECLKERII